MSTGKTIGVFQVESRGFRDLITRVKPDCFEDIIALVALYRPGPLQSGMVDDFIDRKHGLAPIVYSHPLVEGILKPTYGIILYQEQVMQIAQVLAGYSLGAADLLRRAMGKKKPEEMKQQREIFLTGSFNNGVDSKIAEGLFDLMEKFSGYGFNKSHAGAYALIVYQTLYLKTHAAAPFFAATLTADADNLEKLAIFIDEVRDLKITLHPPCVNDSKIEFFSKSECAIQYGLGAIKGLGEQALKYIIQNREMQGPYASFQCFLKRLAQTPLSKKHIEILIKVGAFDTFQPNRKALLLHDLPHLWERFHKGHFAQKGLFDAEDDQDLLDRSDPIDDDLWSQRIALERQLLGISLSGTSFDPYRSLAPGLWKDQFVGSNIPILASLISSRRIFTQKGAILVATQWVLMCGQKSEYYLNPLKPHDSELLTKIETLNCDRPVLIFCDKLQGSEQRKERVILKNILTIPAWVQQNSLHFVLTPLDLEHKALIAFLKNITKHVLPCPLYLKYPLVGSEKSYGSFRMKYQPPQQAIEGDLLNFIESAYPVRTWLSLKLVTAPKI
jgi:DNA polymerase-3 subunit alpha